MIHDNDARALVAIPVLDIDQMANIIVPQNGANNLRHLRQLLIIKAGDRRSRFLLAIKKYDQILYKAKKIDLKDKNLEAYLLHSSTSIPIGFWQDAGIPKWRLNDSDFFASIVNDNKKLNYLYENFLKKYPFVKSQLDTSAVILNRFGETVFDSVYGRGLKTKNNEILYASDFPVSKQGRFFIAADSVSFRECAANIAVLILRGQPVHKKDFIQYLRDMKLDAKNERSFREEIEAQIAIRLSSPNARRFFKESSIRADQNLPIGIQSNINTNTISVPFPIAAALQQALAVSEQDKVLIPTFGNGTLASYIVGSGAKIIGYEIENSNFNRSCKAFSKNQSVELYNSDIVNMPATLNEEDNFTCILANPIFKRLNNKIAISINNTDNTFTTDRQDYAIAVKAIEKLRAAKNSRAFIMVSADASNDASDFENFYSYVQSVFGLVSVVQLDASLFKKTSTTCSMFAFALFDKNAVPAVSNHKTNYKDIEINKINNWNEMFSWSEKIVRNSNIVENKNQKDVYPNLNNVGNVTENLELIDPNNSNDEYEEPLFNDLEDEDSLTTQYEPFSKIGVPATVIQKSLHGTTMEALKNVEVMTNMAIDDYVSKKIKIDVSHLGKIFSPEQVDALALAFYRKEHNAGFLNGDLMGVGKGRMLAGCAMEALKNNESVIFMTDKPALFQDFFARDMTAVFEVDVKKLLEEKIKLAIFNQQNADIKDLRGKVVYKGSNIKISEDVDISPDINFIGLSYSQFQTASGKWKLESIIKWLEKQKENGHTVQLILDESHKAAGDSSVSGERTTTLVEEVSRLGGNVVYSSATALKSCKNIELYSKILPKTNLKNSELVEIIEQNPLVFQEILMTDISREGGMISREVGAINAIRSFVPLSSINEVKMNKIRVCVDKTAFFLTKLIELAHTINAKIKDTEKEVNLNREEKEKISLMPVAPTRNFHIFSQYLVLAIKGNFLTELALQSISAGERVLIATENTSESILNEIIASKTSKADLNNEILEDDEIFFSDLPTIGDILKKMADKFSKITGLQKQNRKVLSVTIPEVTALIESFKREVNNTDFSMLCVTPIDRTREELESLGIPTDEISGRRRRLERTDGGNGLWKIKNWSQKDRNKAVFKFNNGFTDVMFLNSSAATGISMHPSPSNGNDLRPCTMIKAQLQKDVTSERQIEGRISRYGQVHAPKYLIPMSGFSADDRLCQLFNRNNRSLTSASNATRENNTNINESLDLLNSIGESIVKQYLEDRPVLADKLDINVKTDDNFAIKLLGRLICLPISEQEGILSALDARYHLQVEALNARGLNPLKLAQHDWNAEVVTKCVLLEGDENAHLISLKPVNVVELKYKEYVEPISFSKALALAEKNRLKIDPLTNLAGDEWLKYKENDVHVDVKTADQRLSIHFLNSLPNLKIDFSHPIFNKIMEKIRYTDKNDNWKENIDDFFYCLLYDVKRKTHDTSINDLLCFSLLDEAPKNLMSKLPEFKFFQTGLNRSLFLLSTLEYMNIGQIAALPPELLPISADTEIGRKCIFNDNERLSISAVPFVVVDIKYPKEQEDLLDLAKWHVKIAVPGEDKYFQFSLAAFYKNYNEFLQKTAFAMKTKRQKPYIGIGKMTLSHLFDNSLIKISNWPMLGKIINCEETCRALLGDEWFNRAIKINDRIEDRFKKLFDEAPAGQVERTRLALMGNLFLGIKIAGKNLAEKIIFLDNKGKNQHALLLSTNNKNLMNDLTNSARRLTAPILSSDPATKSVILMRIYGVLLCLDDDKKLSNYKEPEQIEEVINDIFYLCFDKKYNNHTDQKNDPIIRQKISDNIDEILQRFKQSINSPLPSSILIGDNVEELLDVFPDNRDRKREKHKFDALKISMAARKMTPNSIILGGNFADQQLPFMIFKKTNKILKNEKIWTSDKFLSAVGNGYCKLLGGAVVTSHLNVSDIIGYIRGVMDTFKYTPLAFGGIDDLQKACVIEKNELLASLECNNLEKNDFSSTPISKNDIG